MVAEWVFIFIPILFHAAVGLWIISGGLPNVARIPTAAIATRCSEPRE